MSPRSLMHTQGRRLLATAASPAAAAAAREASPLLPLVCGNPMVSCKGLPQAEDLTNNPQMRAVVQRMVRGFVATDASPTATATATASAPAAAAREASALLPLLHGCKGLHQAEDLTNNPQMRAALQRMVRDFVATDASPTVTATARHGSPLTLPALTTAPPCKGRLLSPVGLDPLAASRSFCSSEDPSLKISAMGAPTRPFSCKQDRMGMVSSVNGSEQWTTMNCISDPHASGPMGLKMVVAEPEKPKDEMNEEAPTKDDGSPEDSHAKDDKSSPSDNEGAADGNRAGGGPPPGDGNRGGGDWKGGVFENYILHQLSEMRREQREESWRNYERTVMLQKDIEEFRRDTDNKIGKVQLVLSNTALRLLGSFILFLVAGVKFLLPYLEEYIDMVWKSKKGGP